MSVAIPDMQSFLLEHRDVGQTRKKEQVKVLGLPRTGNDTARKNIANLITFVRSKVQDNPDIDPTVRLLVVKELCAIDREHQDCVVVVDLSVFHSIKIVGSTEDVIPDKVSTLIMVSQEVLCFISPIVHFLSHSRTLPTGLELWADGKRCEQFLRDFGLAIGLLKLLLVIARFVTFWAIL